MVVGLLVAWAVCAGAWQPRDVFVEEAIDARRLQAEVVEMTVHAFDSYRNYAGFDNDELKPLSCRGHRMLGGLSTTLIDSLDMMAVLGDEQSFTEGVDWVLANIKSFDVDSNVSVFETNIRILGGLLSAHMLASNRSLGVYRGEYSGDLLRLCVDLADRLLVAFQTPTKLPFGTVNLRHGVPVGESRVVCAACAATYSLEFGMLSVLTGDLKYERAAKEAAEALWMRRNPHNLLSTHLEIDYGSWVLQSTCGLGGDTDSSYEYFWKAWQAFGDETYRRMFEQAYAGVQKMLRVDGGEDGYLYFVDADFVTGQKTLTVRSLSAFWPGILAQVGRLDDANRTIHSFAEIVEALGYLPESVCATMFSKGAKIVSRLGAEPFSRGAFMDGYPLRPELIESVYHLYSITRDPSLLAIALRAQQALRKARVTCGFCSVHGILQRNHILHDQMDSFVISETFKYLYLLWDLASDDPDKNWVNRGGYVFTTEAHLLPLASMRGKLPSSVVNAAVFDRPTGRIFTRAAAAQQQQQQQQQQQVVVNEQKEEATGGAVVADEKTVAAEQQQQQQQVVVNEQKEEATGGAVVADEETVVAEQQQQQQVVVNEQKEEAMGGAVVTDEEALAAEGADESVAASESPEVSVAMDHQTHEKEL